MFPYPGHKDKKALAHLVSLLERLEQRHGHFMWQAAFTDLAIIMAHVQLALKHPANNGYSAQRARTIVEAWIEHLEKSEPGIAQYLASGLPDN